MVVLLRGDFAVATTRLLFIEFASAVVVVVEVRENRLIHRKKRNLHWRKRSRQRYQQGRADNSVWRYVILLCVQPQPKFWKERRDNYYYVTEI